MNLKNRGLIKIKPTFQKAIYLTCASSMWIACVSQSAWAQTTTETPSTSPVQNSALRTQTLDVDNTPSSAVNQNKNNPAATTASGSILNISRENMRSSRSVRPAPSIDPQTRVLNKPVLPLNLYAGQVRIVEQAGVQRVAIGNGDLLTATVVADRQIVLLGQKPGNTTLFVWLRDGRQMNYEITINAEHISKTSRDLHHLLAAEPGIKSEVVGDKIIIDGVYANEESAIRIKKITQAYPQILNLVRDRPEDNLVVPRPMIQLDVKVIEVRKQALDEIGIKWSNLNVPGLTFATSGYLYADTANFRGGGGLAPGYPVTTPSRPFVSYFGLASQITSALNFLEKNGDSWTLAEPRVSAVSGGKSKVHIGGEIPIPVSAGFGQIDVIYKQYGVILEFDPMIDKAGNVYSKITAEVSQPDRSNGSGEFVAFSSNRTETEVSLKQNETLVISGLLRQVGSRNREGIPGLGNIPIVGRLFSTQGVTQEQYETLVVVTPKLHKANPDKEEVLAEEVTYQRMKSAREAIQKNLSR
jgi:pilus assembly protein CpaC